MCGLIEIQKDTDISFCVKVIEAYGLILQAYSVVKDFFLFYFPSVCPVVSNL